MTEAQRELELEYGKDEKIIPIDLFYEPYTSDEEARDEEAYYNEKYGD